MRENLEWQLQFGLVLYDYFIRGAEKHSQRVLLRDNQYYILTAI